MTGFRATALGWFVLLAPLTEADQKGAKPPDAWTDEERFTARFAPGSARRRLEDVSKRSSEMNPKVTARYLDVVDGSADPALLFPIELFRGFVHLILPRIGGEPRPGHDEDVAGDVDAGARVAGVHKAYAAKLCRNLHAFMASVARELGERRQATFVAFLYRETAPQMLIIDESDTTSPEAALRARVRGCP